MNANMELEEWSYSIEGALCKFDYDMDNTITDEIAIKILELLIDQYHFGDVDFNFDNPVIENGFHYIDKIIQEDLFDLEQEVIVKLLSVIRFVAVRRTLGGKEHMDVLHRYVGARVSPGARIIRVSDL